MNKKTVQILSAICLLIFVGITSSCKKDDEKKVGQNVFVFGDENYSVVQAIQIYMGKSPGNSNGIMLWFHGEEYSIGVIALVPTTKDYLVAQNYYPNNNGEPYTVLSSVIGYANDDEEFELLYEIEDLSLNVSQSNSTYIINLGGTVDGENLVGNYTGVMQMFDGSNTNWNWSSRDANKNMVIKPILQQN